MLDNLPESGWFLCLPITFAVFIIALLGALHPVAWIRVMRAYRSEMFVFMYTIIIVWSVLSVMLIYALLASSSCIYVFWCYYTLAFGATMVGLMGLVLSGFFVLGQKRKAVIAALALMYYLVTLYLVLVVNTHRKQIFGLQQHDCGEEGCKITKQLKETELATGNTTGTTTGMMTTTGTTTGTTTTGTITATTTGTITATTTGTTTETATGTTTETTTGTTPSKKTEITKSKNSQPVDKQTEPNKKPGELRKAAMMNQRTTEQEQATETTAPSETTEIMQSTMDPAKNKIRQKKKSGRRKAAKAKLLNADEHKQPPQSSDDDPIRGYMDPEDLDIQPRAKMNRLPKVTSDDCSVPRKPAHGRYEVHRDRSSLRLRLRCKVGYRENSIATECKYNWWDRPLPQCRKRRDPPPLSDPDGGCVMPRYPSHGEYTVVAEAATARPGDHVKGDKVILQVMCEEPYRAVDPYVVCEGGQWRHAPPSCQKHCKLTFNPTVEYKCLKPFKDKFLSCHAWQPNGATVAAACRPGHAHRGPFKYMRCRGDTWDHEVACLPNANFTRFISTLGQAL